MNIGEALLRLEHHISQAVEHYGQRKSLAFGHQEDYALATKHEIYNSLRYIDAMVIALGAIAPGDPSARASYPHEALEQMYQYYMLEVGEKNAIGNILHPFNYLDWEIAECIADLAFLPLYECVVILGNVIETYDAGNQNLKFWSGIMLPRNAN